MTDDRIAKIDWSVSETDDAGVHRQSQAFTFDDGSVLFIGTSVTRPPDMELMPPEEVAIDDTHFLTVSGGVKEAMDLEALSAAARFRRRFTDVLAKLPGAEAAFAKLLE